MIVVALRWSSSALSPLLPVAMGPRFRGDDSFLRSSHLRQRVLKVLDQIVDMFEARGVADEAFADAEFGARIRRQALMRRGRGMGDEALGVAEIVRDPRQFQCVEVAVRSRLSDLPLKADQR